MHHIQNDILSNLATRTEAKFSELRPPDVEANLYTYHLNTLCRQGYVEKNSKKYSLSSKGLAYVDRMSRDTNSLRVQPKIITMTILQSDDNAIFLYPKHRQPFLGCWNIPNGKVHLEDVSVKRSAVREVKEKTGFDLAEVTHTGDAYIRVRSCGILISSVLAHIFIAKITHAELDVRDGAWMNSDQRKSSKLAPAVAEIIDTALSAKHFFFEEYDVEW
jgi:ADP-ribose pyrophosphatase YjhB (NUDIX family)